LTAYWNLVPIGLLQGFLFGIVALGIMMPFRFLNFPDITSEGAFPLGGAVAAALLANGVDPVSATVVAAGCGLVAGFVTAMTHLYLRLNSLLCGILVVTALFSIDIRIMGKPNTALFTYDDIYGLVLGTIGEEIGARVVLVGGVALAMSCGLLWFLRTQTGLAMRAVGASPSMARAQGISVPFYTILGVGLAGGCAAIAGALTAQNQAFADVNMGLGVLVNGLASLILGEQIMGRGSLPRQLLAPLVGALVYFQIINLALAFGVEPSDLKLLTAVFVFVMLAVAGRFRREA
jgi:putative tryptophan/tyrosine transport system permease protein